MGKLRIKTIVGENYDAISKLAAEEVVSLIKSKPTAVIGFATGSTPLGIYKELIRLHKEEGVDFGEITTFNLDEYYPISKDNDQSYFYFMHENLFNHINVNKSKVNILNGQAADWKREAEEYEEKIEKAGGIDLQILGIGNNGHIAFNEPANEFTDATTLVRLTDDTIKANSRFFEKEEDVPKEALSMGIGTIMASKKILLIASGEGKAEAVNKALNGGITPKVPASVLRLHRNVMFFMDKGSYKQNKVL